MSTSLVEPAAWSRVQFQECDLGDVRRTERLIKYASQMAERPDASTPEQTESWADCKAAYRLFDQEEVTFDAVIAPHNHQTLKLSPGTYLVVSDTTELDFGYLRQVPGLGRLGAMDRRGFFLHSALVVAPAGGRVIGLAAQQLFTRRLKKIPRESFSKRKKRPCETDVWGKVIARVRPSTENVKLIHVCDRGADNFDVFSRLQVKQDSCVIRAAQLTRIVFRLDGTKAPLQQVLAEAPLLGTYEIQVPENKKQKARIAQVEVRSVAVVMPRPLGGVSRFVRKHDIREIPLQAVEVREVKPPRKQEALHWVLYTFEKAASFESSWRVIEHYEKRPVIEEYHKCQKSGCQVETRQYQHADRLAPVIALTCVLAVRLLQLRDLSRQEPDLPAEKVVPRAWIEALRRVLKRPRPLKTVRNFFRAVASLGGFLGRKHDGEPGWQTIWRGMEKLIFAARVLGLNES